MKINIGFDSGSSGLGTGKGLWGMVVGQAVEGQVAHGEGDGNPAFALVGAAEV
jgi:hypothetical protein